MDNILRKILTVMREKKITNRQLQRDLDLYASAVSEWKNGSSESYIKHLPRIAEYLGVSTEYLLGNTDIRTLDEQLQGIDFALSGEIRELNDNEKQDVLDYIRFKKKQKGNHQK